MKMLFDFAKFHQVCNIVFTALSKLNLPNADEVLSDFVSYSYLNIAISTQQQYYLEQICSAFEEAGILYMPMKGNVIKFLYPDPTLRSSGDIDIYIDKEKTKETKTVMESLGFQSGAFESEVLIHDTYSIGGRIHVELHYELMPHIPYFKGVEVCPDIEKSIIRVEPYKYSYRMTDEDFYVFMIIHIAKHVKHNGMGIRGYLDVWIYLRKYGNTLNWSKIEQRMKACGLTEFDKNVRMLVDYWFNGKKDVPECVIDFAQHVSESGAMGTTKQIVSEEMYKNYREGKKSRYYKEVIFKPLPFMCDEYKILRKAPVLLPFCWIHRIFKVIIFKRRKISVMVKHYDGADINIGKKSTDLKEKLGL